MTRASDTRRMVKTGTGLMRSTSSAVGNADASNYFTLIYLLGSIPIVCAVVTYVGGSL